jgi:glutathione S-transferase
MTEAKQTLRLYCPQTSTYGRIAAITALECGLDFEVVPTATNSPEQYARHPFGKAPSAEIDGLQLYETAAICQYLDDRFNASALQGATLRERAYNVQWLSVANSYLFPISEFGLVLPRLVVPLMGGVAREDLIEAALPQVYHVLKVLSARLDHSPFFAGSSFLQSDVFLYVMVRAVQLTPEGAVMLQHLPPLAEWLSRIQTRAAVRATEWPIE